MIHKSGFVCISKIIILIGIGVIPIRANAITILKEVQVVNENQLDLVFDRNVDKKQIETEFFRDIIQLSLKDVAVYPAKILNLSGKELTKIFAYQYTPRLVRFRVTTQESSEKISDRIKVKAEGKVVSIRVVPVMGDKQQDQVLIQAAQAIRAGDDPKSAQLEASKAAPAPMKMDKNDETLLQNVLLNSDKKAEKAPVNKSGFSGSMSSVFKAFGWMTLLLLAMVALAITIKKVRGSGWMGKISKIAAKGLGKSGRLIEVISNHHLGPKKSLAVVRIKGRLLVVGITNDSINLITQLEGEEDLNAMFDAGEDTEALLSQIRGPSSGVGARSAGPAIFADSLNSAQNKPQVDKTPLSSPVRDQIRRRVEGMKVL